MHKRRNNANMVLIGNGWTHSWYLLYDLRKLSCHVNTSSVQREVYSFKKKGIRSQLVYTNVICQGLLMTPVIYKQHLYISKMSNEYCVGGLFMDTAFEL